MTYKVNLKYFASIREAIGQGSESVSTQAATLKDLRDELIARGGAYAEVLAHGLEPRLVRRHGHVEQRLRSGLLPTRHWWLNDKARYVIYRQHPNPRL
jgi:molybdopterin converting factor small subunit